METMLDYALRYAELGYPVFPCIPGRKDPACEHGCLDATTDIQTIENWWSENPCYNIGISTNGLCVLDVDGVNNPFLRTAPLDDLLGCPLAKTPRGGSHYWFRQNGTELKSTTSTVAPDVDTRANGGYVLAFPSEVGGKRYSWVEELTTPDQLPVVPSWLFTTSRQKTPLAESSEVIREGARNKTLYRWACAFRGYGMSPREILCSVAAINLSRCKPPIDDDELRTICESAANQESDTAKAALVAPEQPRIDAILIQPSPPVEAEEREDPRIPEFPHQCITTAPYLIRLAFDYMMETAIRPQPELNLGASIALLGTVFGREVEDDFQTRTNIYVLALADSGTGKEHARKCNKQILNACNLVKMIGPERVGSHAGVVAQVAVHPIRLFQLDEIGRLLLTMKSPEASHLYNIGTVLMQLYSSSNCIWIGDAYADVSKVKTIDQPHVCLYGTSVPEHFYDGLTPESLKDGLLGRMFVLNATSVLPPQRPRKLPPPFELTEAIKGWHARPREGNLIAEHPQATTIPKTHEASDRHWKHITDVMSRNTGEDETTRALWSRAPEKSAKLALIYAMAENPFSPTIGLEAVNWGRTLANYSTRLMIGAVGENVSGSYYHAQKQKVWKRIEHGMTLSCLQRRTQWLRPRERKEILDDLANSGAIEAKIEETKGRPRTTILKLREAL